MPASASPVIGRDRELESLRQFLDAVPEGPVALLIEGEAGIGKTALWRQAVDLGRQRSYRVLTCRPADSETRLSFSALDDLLAGGPASPDPQPGYCHGPAPGSWRGAAVARDRALNQAGQANNDARFTCSTTRR
jgi:AAA ATPase-like protein